LAMKILVNLFDKDELFETDCFRWDLNGEDDSIPNFWWKNSNIQVQWHNDDPGRGSFTNQEEFTANDAISLLGMVRASYGLWRDGK
jgi:hypothetical protein